MAVTSLTEMLGVYRRLDESGQRGLQANAKLAEDLASNPEDLGSRFLLSVAQFARYANPHQFFHDGMIGDGDALAAPGVPLSQDEAVYPMYYVDADGEKLDASKHDYVLRFPKDGLPPAGAFWSLWMYEAAHGFLIENPIDRNLINSPMLPSLKRDADGGLTLYLQHAAPDGDKKANWLPAPNEPFITELRIYLPKPDVLSGAWKEPPLQKAR